ncbi:RNA polymerase sigma-70 factor [Gordonia rubripertincta]|uniref:RNA polymerase sigma-70 factor n=1 Tax=Gordonia rubripertincta TaxID=36822 RepID=A0ABT4N1L3_GORRU|nr:RNA polymerase sigma-70 factor [Gordonia rubripertincta]MCZ4553152.1 RNA polymerase sigma-70 factor [Gordonia rubripertincta]
MPRNPRSELDDAAAEFNLVRPKLFGIAYRMLGSASEAEDIVQDVWLRWQAYDRSKVENPAAFLSTTTTRLAINAVQSARARHETYIGPWLPEPVDTSADPALGAVRGEALGFAVLLLLEKLTPTERAAYVLRESFDYPYRQIGEIIEVTEANARQLVTRARKHIAAGGSAPVSTSDHRRLLTAFVDAAQTGDLEALTAVLAADVVSNSDGGGIEGVLAARIPIMGDARVAKFVAAFSSHFWTGAQITWVQANGAPSVLLSRDGLPYTLLSATTTSSGIEQLHWVMNPTKLDGFRSSADAASEHSTSG